MGEMFCFQCQETARNTGCTKIGVCGKQSDTSNLQDTIIYTVKGVSYLANILRTNDISTKEADEYIVHSLFMTITNANFDNDQFFDYIKKGLALRDSLKEILSAKNIEFNNNLDILTWTGNTNEEISAKGDKSEVGVLATANEDIRSLRELVTYGLKGLAAYVHHAYVLNYENDEIYAFMHKALSNLLDDSLDADQLVALTLETGKYCVDGMAILDTANTSSYGHPELTKVDLGVRKNPGILITGHDLHDLEELLIQTEGTGVDVYTHGEMLPGQYYPEFKKYKHLAGNYGNAWWQQKEEFKTFNGPILFTTNCIVPPKGDIVKKIFTTGTTGFPGCTHILPGEDGKKDFSEIIELAKTLPSPTEMETGEIIGGFAHNQVFALADKVVESVKNGDIRKFFVMGGCDGRFKSRSYYTEFAEKLPKDTIILTAGCAKYRYLKLNLGDINGIPRVLDAGQCNDSYSTVLIALKLKEVFELEDINELPIAYNIAWYEQKAITVLLALLYLGVKDIHVGPTLPAFLSPSVVDVLVKNFGIATIGTVEDDLKLLLG